VADFVTLNEGSSVSLETPTPLVAHLYVVLDCSAPQRPSTRHSLAGLEVVALGRGEAPGALRQDAGGERRLTLAFPDLRMSRQHARLVREGGRWRVEDLASRNGVFVNGTQVHQVELQDGDVVELGRTFFLFRSAQRAGVLAQEAREGVHTLVPELDAQFAQLGAMARHGVPVLVQGEPGVGKELAARLVHALSGRKGRFVAVNCGELRPELAAASLFGAVKGAYTGAIADQEGFVRAAQHGTLFLDEVGELLPAVQPTLLRVLQEREVTPVGANRPLPVDLQLVAATNQDLQALVEQGRFRADLLSRLGGLGLTLPPLRERREDLGLVVGELLRRLQVPRLTFDRDVARALFAYPWPMNIRELGKVLQVMAALAEGGQVKLDHLPEAVRAPRVALPLEPEEEVLRQRVLVSLETNKGNVSAVARELGVARMQVHRWMKRFGLDPEDYR